MDQKLILNGSMIQPWLPKSWMEQKPKVEIEEHWRQELAYMAAVKMDHLIVQFTIDNTTSNDKSPTAYYPSAMLGFELPPKKSDYVGSLLEVAPAFHIQVWLGLVWDDKWFCMYATDEEWLSRQFTLARRVVDDLWKKYGKDHGATIAGFYMPLEMDNTNFIKPAFEDRMAQNYETLLRHVHAINKPLMIAPYFQEGPGQKAEEYAKMWGRILGKAPVDVLALQDGIGATDFDEHGELKQHCTVEKIAAWMEPLEKAIADVSPKTELWSDLETFIDTKKGADPNVPAPISRVKEQLKREQHFVRKFTSFSFNHFGSPKQNHEAEFKEYKNYVDGIP